MSAWYYVKGTVRNGLVSLDELMQLARSGALDPKELVWNESMSDWAAAGTVQALGFGGATLLSAPTAPSGTYAPVDQGQVHLTSEGMELLRQTRPWAQLMSVIDFAVGGTMASVAFVMVGLAIFGPRSLDATDAIAPLLVGLACLCVAPGIYLYRYASWIERLLATRKPAHLEQALRAQKSFLKFTAIMMLVVTGLYVVNLLVTLSRR